MSEAIKVADLICIMRGGNVLQYDTPENILKNPADDYVANFVGKTEFGLPLNILRWKIL